MKSFISVHLFDRTGKTIFKTETDSRILCKIDYQVIIESLTKKQKLAPQSYFKNKT